MNTNENIILNTETLNQGDSEITIDVYYPSPITGLYRIVLTKKSIGVQFPDIFEMLLSKYNLKQLTGLLNGAFLIKEGRKH